jgi:hypothetical protein
MFLAQFFLEDPNLFVGQYRMKTIFSHNTFDGITPRFWSLLAPLMKLKQSSTFFVYTIRGKTYSAIFVALKAFGGCRSHIEGP